MKNKLQSGLFIGLSIIFLSSNVNSNMNHAYAETLSNQQYMLEIKPNTIQDQIQELPPEPTTNQSEPELLPEPFTFSLDQLLVDFGLLSPTNPIIRSNAVTINQGSANGYTFQIFENRQLSTEDKQSLIPDTSCDNGSCTQEIASSWQTLLSYGLGYRCENVSGSSCISGFNDTSHYKRLPSMQNNEKPEVVLISNNNKSSQANIIYRLNVANTQKNQLYTNTVTYIASPNY